MDLDLKDLLPEAIREKVRATAQNLLDETIILKVESALNPLAQHLTVAYDRQYKDNAKEFLHPLLENLLVAIARQSIRILHQHAELASQIEAALPPEKSREIHADPFREASGRRKEGADTK